MLGFPADFASPTACSWAEDMISRILIPWKDSGDSGRARIVEYLGERNFVRKGLDKNQEVFQRGSILGNLVAFNMMRVKTVVRLYRKGDYLVVKYKVTSFGQAFTADDCSFFELECQSIEAVGMGMEKVPDELWEHFEEVARGGWFSVLKAGVTPLLIVALVIGFSVLRSGGAGSDKVPEPSGQQLDQSGFPAVYLVPFDGFPEPMAQWLASWLSQDTGVYVKAIPAAAMDFAYYNEFRDQFAAESFYEGMQRVIADLPERTEETTVIFITDKDIYLETANFRFVFSSHWKNLSLVGTGRYGDANSAHDTGSDVFKVRTLKLLKRSIGMHVFNYPRSSDPERVMFAPITGIPVLDRIDLEKW